MPALLAAWETEAGLWLKPRYSRAQQSTKIGRGKERGVGERKRGEESGDGES